MITIKNEKEIELMRKAGEMVGKAHAFLKPYLKPGITTKEIDNLCLKFIKDNGCTAPCKGYCGFPASLCVSVNDEVIHGIPGSRKLENGDIVTLDIVIGYKGYQGDSAWSYAIGEISDDKKYIMKHTEEALYVGIDMVKPGNRIGDISNAIENYCNKYNLGIVREFTGHGIGKEMHEDPEVPNYGAKGKGPRLQEGMVICIEPMLTFGNEAVYELSNGWTIKTRDRSPAAHYEHTVLVTKTGYEILTTRFD